MCIAQEAEEEAKREARRKKNEEKRQQQIIESSGADGKVAALDSVRFSGTFGVSFSREPERTMTKAELRVARMNGDLMLPEVDSEQNGPLAKQSAKKQVLLCMSSGTTIQVSAYYHINGRILLRVCPHFSPRTTPTHSSIQLCKGCRALSSYSCVICPQAGFELGRRNYLIKKAKKMEKQKEKREMKSGKKQVIKLKKKSDKMKD